MTVLLRAAKEYVEGLTQYGPMDPVAEGFISGAEWVVKILNSMGPQPEYVASKIEQAGGRMSGDIYFGTPADLAHKLQEMFKHKP